MISYCIDSNAIIIMNRHMPRDVYEGPWAALEQLVRSGRLYMPREVYEELRIIDDYCAPWAKSMDGFVVDPNEDEIACVLEIATAHPKWVQEQRNRADPWLVAHGKVHQRIVVSDEKMAGPGALEMNLKIPNVASEHSVECITLVELARREQWRFT